MNANKTGQFISMLRKEKQWTQAELAAQLNVTDKAVSKWERGLGLPDINTIEPLAEVLGVDVLEVMRGERIPEETELPPVETIGETFAYVRESEKFRRQEFKWLFGSTFLCAVGFFLFLAGTALTIHYVPAENRNFGVILSILPLIGAMVLFVALAIRLLGRSRIVKVIAKLILLYLFYTGAVCAVFWLAGLYTFTTPPSMIVAIRLVIYPAVFTLLTAGLLLLLHKKEN